MATRFPFRVIDPVTEQFHKVPEPGGAGKRGLSKRSRGFFAVSYVWSEWKDHPTDPLPNWSHIRNRLLQLSTTNIFAPSDPIRPEASGLFRCWIDCKCINQSSPIEKSYWVPRMNEVFYGARSTVLLLRHFDLTGLYELFRITRCIFSEISGIGKVDGAAPRHQCLFSPSCIALDAPFLPALETLCLQTLAALWNGAWRKRAWIFQEILLSERYILSWGNSSVVAYIDLATVGYIAAFLQSRHPQKSWLHDFWTWCKRCIYIRQLYSKNCDLEATILQLAVELEATIPCDKYYALCGLLGLDNVQYDPRHTLDQALDAVVAALTRQGRMGWMYAIPPCVQEGIAFSSTHMAPFVLTKKKRQRSVAIREPFFSGQ